MSGRLAAAALLLVAAASPALAADATITAEPTDRYGAAEITVAAGDGLAFANHDLNRHDVTADGDKPAFRSPLVATGGEAAVSGVAQLLPGSYGFHCSLHSFMTGRLAVTGLRVRVPAQSLSAARRAVRVRAALWPQGAATISATLAGRSLPAVQRTLAGATTVRIAVPAKVRRALRTAARARLVVSVGAAGASARATRTLR